MRFKIERRHRIVTILPPPPTQPNLIEPDPAPEPQVDPDFGRDLVKQIVKAKRAGRG